MGGPEISHRERKNYDIRDSPSWRNLLKKNSQKRSQDIQRAIKPSADFHPHIDSVEMGENNIHRATVTDYPEGLTVVCQTPNPHQPKEHQQIGREKGSVNPSPTALSFFSGGYREKRSSFISHTRQPIPTNYGK